MSEELSLVTELAIILIAAGVFTVISKALKQPVILGYIIAGFLVGPHLGLFPQLSTESVHHWSEIGIIFLLFSLGLEFSFKKLMKVGSAALITAGTNCIAMFFMGMMVGGALGWGMMECVFLGGMLSMSSTTIIIKAYDDLGLKNRPYAGLVFGTLVVEDLIAVLLMVLLTTLAVSNQFAGGEMLMGLAKLAFFLILSFLVGIFLLPTLLKKFNRYLTDEIMLLVAVGLCFLMVVLANVAGFSSALGAFVMGSILSESIEGERIEHLTVPIKNLFGAIFFVSVGMMVDPAVIAAHWGTILVLTIVTMGGILVFSSTGVLLSGKGIDIAVHTGFSLAQLGEFSFIIAGLGCSLGVLRDFIYPVIISVSVITTFTTPYMIKAADPVSIWLYKKLPAHIVHRLDPSQDVPNDASGAEKNEWKKLLKSYAVRVGLYSVLLVAIISASSLLEPLSLKLMPGVNETLRKLLVVGVTLVVMAPFLYGMSVTSGSINGPASKLLKEKPSNKWPILSLIVLRVMLGVVFVVSVILEHFALSGWSLVLMVLSVAVVLFSVRLNIHKVSGLESRFMSNLTDKEARERKLSPVTTSFKEKMAAYDVHVESLTVSPDFSYAGKTLREMPFRHEVGVNIVKIIRGSSEILIPSGEEVIFPGDRLLAVGTTEQIDAFVRMMNENSERQAVESKVFALEAVPVTEESYMNGKSLRELNMRASSVMVISVVRDGKLLTNPKPDFSFLAGDVVWLSGDKASVEWYK